MSHAPSTFWRSLIRSAQRLFAAPRRLSKNSSRILPGRRALLTGRFWEVAPTEERQLVARYPTPESDDQPAPTPQSLHGISIEAVATAAPNAESPARSIPVFRPPGAIEETQFLAGCTRCGDCITACPHDAIRVAPPRLGDRVAGTPIIEADTQACLMCEDFPCIASCEPGVLTDRVPPVMGAAVVTEHLCLAHHHTTCTVCSERCPVEGAFTVTEGKPTINEAACTGCGVCRYVCPAPENAILLMPTFSRPRPASREPR